MDTIEPFSILIVGDEKHSNSGLAKDLACEADLIESAFSVSDAIRNLEKYRFRLVILDSDLYLREKESGLLQKLRCYPLAPSVIIINNSDASKDSLDAICAGALDVIQRPVDLNLVRYQIRRAKEHLRLQAENRLLRNRLAEAGQLAEIITRCSTMEKLLQQIRQIASTDVPVMIHGESGTGKSLLARAIHELSPRSTAPFVSTQLGLFPQSFIERELLGTEQAPLSSPQKMRISCYERASNGTLFLDDLTEITAKDQADLLRVIGIHEPLPIATQNHALPQPRLISATTKSANEIIDSGLFREDLFYRLRACPIEIPPLRNRPEEIPYLAEHFLQFYSRKHYRKTKVLSEVAMDTLLHSAWPGNVRQLRNVIERLVLTIQKETIEKEDIPTVGDAFSPPIRSLPPSLSGAVEEYEKGVIRDALNACGLHRENTARTLGISVRTLHYKMSRYGMH